ncbi:hypothetical protein FRX31_008132 [Thalictrum thalictroides]|uniref:Uncharacterized protein n=1 Tax=Thalictrum thalictroides TaxID=46969 RepID=A0A7J6X0M7_THATH|nr:hypothetical protein FRX31_008132 [Thalictrum thalictroides]
MLLPCYRTSDSGLAERVAVADEKRDLAGEPTLAGVVAGSDSITSANLRVPSACNKRSQKPLFDRLRPVSAI